MEACPGRRGVTGACMCRRATGVGARSVAGEGWALSLGQSPPGGLCVGSDGGRQRPLISAKSNPPSHRRSRNRVQQGRRRNDPLLNGDRASGRCDRLDRWP